MVFVSGGKLYFSLISIIQINTLNSFFRLKYSVSFRTMLKFARFLAPSSRRC